MPAEARDRRRPGQGPTPQLRPDVRVIRRSCGAALLALLLASAGAAQTGPPPPPAPAPVAGRVSGTVVYADPVVGLFVQTSDETVAVVPAAFEPMVPGDCVEASGMVTLQGGRRTMAGARVTRLGSGTFPPARELDPAALALDTQPNDWIEVTALVREVVTVNGHTELAAGVDGNQLNIVTPAVIPGAGRLLDAVVRIRGVRRVTQVFGTANVQIYVPQLAETDIVRLATIKPFDVPLETVTKARSEPRLLGHRVRLQGTILLKHGSLLPNRRVVHIEDATGTILVDSGDDIGAVGDRVMVSGYPIVFFGQTMLGSGMVQRVGDGAMPVPHDATIAAIRDGSLNNRLVRLRGAFVQYSEALGAKSLVMEVGGEQVTVYFYPVGGLRPLPSLERGSIIDAVGMGQNTVSLDGVTPTVMVTTAGAEAITLIDTPSWWTPVGRVAAAVAAGICLLALRWRGIGVLNARVRKQTRALDRAVRAHRRAAAALDRPRRHRQRRHPHLGPQGRLTVAEQDRPVHRSACPKRQALQRTLQDIVAPESAALSPTRWAASAAEPHDRIELEVRGRGRQAHPARD